MKNTLFWMIGIFAVGLAFGLALGGFFGASTSQPLMIATTQTVQETEEEPDEEVQEKSELWETMDFDEQHFVILQEQKFMHGDEEWKLFHLCSSTISQMFVSDTLETSWCSNSGLAERLLLVTPQRQVDLQIPHTESWEKTGNILWSAAMHPDSNHVLVGFEPAECDYEGMCFETLMSVLVFDVETGVQTQEMKDLPGLVFSVDQFLFSPDGTKFVMFTPCAEGCPPDMIVGYDLQTQESTSLLSRGDMESPDYYEWWPDDEKSHWIDDSTFQVTVWHELPQSDERETKTIDLSL